MFHRILAQFKEWAVDSGCWYLGSATAHAVALFCIGLIAVAIPRTLGDLQEPPAFDAPDMGRDAEPAPVERFEVGDAPLEPSRLDTASLTEWKAQPIGGPTEENNDDSPDFEPRGGGTPTDRNGQPLGGGGFMGPDMPGPAGPGGVGVSAGFGKNWGTGGDGTGFGGRGKGHRIKGATGPTERAVAAALNWLYRHQNSSGKWSLDFTHQCRGARCTSPGRVTSDMAATALATLPFLAAGQTHKSKGPYKQTLAKALNWLKTQQRGDGALWDSTPKPMYAHALATMALAEAYGMTKDDGIGKVARRAVAFIERAQNQATGGWRYVPGEQGDTSVFGWQIMALKSAQLAGLPVESKVFDNAQKWLHAVAKGEHLGLYSYQPYDDCTPARTAIGLLCRQYLGASPRDPSILESKRSLMENLPGGDVDRNCYYWYYATLAMHNFLDSDWDTWNRKMRTALIESQDREGCAAGSWDPEKPTMDTWGSMGGRLMTTCLNALTLEVYYRYSAHSVPARRHRSA